jgi:hypothetical protein
LYNEGGSILYTAMYIVNEDPGSKPDKIYDRRIDWQICIWKTSNQLKNSSEKNAGLYAIYLCNGKGVDLKVVVVFVVVVKFTTVLVARRDSAKPK